MYKGVVIEESLSDMSILQELNIVKTEVSEDGVDWQPKVWYKHTINVPDENVDEIADKLSEVIKESWYIHLWKGGEMIVIFRGKKFYVRKGDSKTIKETIKYGLSVGIPEYQLDFEGFFE